ncbi:hypothetical protein [Paracoccus sp. PAMC 22219]|uniref:hypothetical protein n=1 Tax=Paracoccus sp. PAMC 22219 TaxID=1569209 RepID=UPI000AF1998F|nr:hypothetical protein [Paracoccus sp. PAMC 22219]
MSAPGYLAARPSFKVCDRITGDEAMGRSSGVSDKLQQTDTPGINGFSEIAPLFIPFSF